MLYISYWILPSRQRTSSKIVYLHGQGLHCPIRKLLPKDPSIDLLVLVNLFDKIYNYVQDLNLLRGNRYHIALIN